MHVVVDTVMGAELLKLGRDEWGWRKGDVILDKGMGEEGGIHDKSALLRVIVET